MTATIPSRDDDATITTEPATSCAAPGCDRPVPRHAGRGRPAIYCSPACRPARRHTRLAVELHNPDTSPDGRPAERVWTVRLRRGTRVVVIANDLGWPSANALARELTDLLQPAKGGATD